jgi:predicted MFS family arabinose efflux permease
VTDLHPKPTVAVSVLLAIAQILVWGGSFFLMAMLAVPVVKDTGWSQQWVYGSLSLGILISGLLAPMVGRGVARMGGRLILASSGLIIALGLALIASAPNLPCFVLAWVVMGVGMSVGLYDPLFATLGQLYGNNARSAITRITLISGFCTTLVWPLLAILIEHFGWREACLVYSTGLALFVLPIYLCVFPKHVPVMHPSTAHPSIEKALSNVVQERTLMLLTAGFILASVIMTAISVQLIAVLQAQGISLTAALGIAALLGPSQVGARAIDMLIGRQTHPIWSALGSSVLVALGLMCVIMSPAMAALGIVLYGAGSGIRSIVRGTLPLALFGARNYPIVLGRIARPTLIAQALTPLAGGYLQERYGATVTMMVLGGLALINVVLVLMLLIEVRKTPKPTEANVATTASD